MKGNNAFSMIEIMAVMAIMIILISIGVPAYSSWRNRSRVAKARAVISKLEMALERYKTDFGVYPGTGNLNKLVTPDDPSFGPYIDSRDFDMVTKQFIDPWRRSYVYSYTLTDNYFALKSDGPDKTTDTTDDITNEQQW